MGFVVIEGENYLDLEEFFSFFFFSFLLNRRFFERYKKELKHYQEGNIF